MRALTIASTVIIAAVGVTSAQAGGFAVREQSAYGQGSSFAGMAAPGDSISSMFWNPAAVTSVSRTTVEGSVTGIFPRSELDVDLSDPRLAALGITGDGGNVGETGIVPAGYFAMPLTDAFYIGMSITAPYGLTTTSDAPWVGMFSHLDAEAVSINATPMIGIKFNDMVSFGIGMQIEYFDVDIETALLPIASPPRQRLEGDDVGIGMVAGLTLTPFDGTVIGIGYRSMIDHSLNGTQSFDIPLRTPLGTIPARSFPIVADIEVPDTISVGVRQRINEAFTVMGGFEWTNWSRIQTVPFTGSPAVRAWRLTTTMAGSSRLAANISTIPIGHSGPAWATRSRRPRTRTVPCGYRMRIAFGRALARATIGTNSLPSTLATRTCSWTTVRWTRRRQASVMRAQPKAVSISFRSACVTSSAGRAIPGKVETGFPSGIALKQSVRAVRRFITTEPL